MVSNFCLIGKICHNFLVPTMIELGCKTFMPIQTFNLHRVLNLGRYIHTITLLSTQKAMTVINYVGNCGIVVLEIVLPISYLSEYIHLILSSDYKICMVIRLHTMTTKMLLKNLSETLQIETFQAANLPPVTED